MREALGLYGRYREGCLDRRQFLKKLAFLAGGAASAASLLPSLEANYARAQVVAADDSRLQTGKITYPVQSGEMQAYWARPRGDDKLPGVIVIHENRGLNPHTEDVARRVAMEGFVAIAPDALSPLGGTPADVSEARSLMGKLDREATDKNFVAAVQYLKSNPQTTGKVGCMGFCWGGRMTNVVAVNAPDLVAAVPFYGSQPSAEDVPRIQAALLCHYGGTDTRINSGIEAFEAALKAAGKEYKIFIYPGAGHAFFNDTGGNYNQEAASLAWKRTIAFFKDKLM